VESGFGSTLTECSKRETDTTRTVPNHDGKGKRGKSRGSCENSARTRSKKKPKVLKIKTKERDAIRACLLSAVTPTDVGDQREKRRKPELLRVLNATIKIKAEPRETAYHPPRVASLEERSVVQKRLWKGRRRRSYRIVLRGEGRAADP